MAKEWDKSKKITKPTKKTPNQILRSVGYGDRFFTMMARYHLKVADAKLVGADVRVKVQGAMGCSYPYVISLNRGDAGEDKIMENRAAAMESLLDRVHQIIAQHNPDIREAPAVAAKEEAPVRRQGHRPRPQSFDTAEA